jgi:hypothetical protein
MEQQPERKQIGENDHAGQAPEQAGGAGRASGNDTVRQAVELARAGKKDAAREILKGVLAADKDNVAAWAAMARLSGSRKEAIFCLKQVLRLQTDGSWATWAQKHLRRLESTAAQATSAVTAPSPEPAPPPSADATGAKTTARTKSKLRRDDVLFWAVAGLLSLGICVLSMLALVGPLMQGGRIAGAVTPGAQSQSDLEQVASAPTTCEALIERALQISDEGCQQIGRNRVCYGHRVIEAELLPGSSDRFEVAGDVIPVEVLRSLSAAPLSLGGNEWGVAVFKLQANLPHTVPGQNVTFMVFGDTSLENTSGDMLAFYFTSGLGKITCKKAPLDGIVIRMPDGAGIAFQVNGADLTLQGTTVLEAETGGDMTITMLDGSGSVSVGGQQQALVGGQALSVPLGGDSGKQAVGPPSAPQTLAEGLAQLGCLLTGSNCPSPAELAEVPPGAPTNTPVPVAPGQPTNTSVPLNPRQPTNTPVPVAPGMPTNTSVPLRTNTPVPVAPGQPTNTPVPLRTNTPIPATNTPIPSNTPVPPTNTPKPTNTPVPPTNTPEPIPSGSCSDIDIDWDGVTAQGNAQFEIDSGYTSDIVLDHISISWPGDNGKLVKIKLQGAIWSKPAGVDSPADIGLGGDASKRTVAPGTTEILEFTFDESAYDGSGYNVTVEFDVGCSRSASH